MSSSVEESSAAAEGAAAEAGTEKGGKTKKKIKFPPGFKLIARSPAVLPLLIYAASSQETRETGRDKPKARLSRKDIGTEGGASSVLACAAGALTCNKGIQRKRDEKRRHVTRKILKKQRAFLLRVRCGASIGTNEHKGFH